MTHHMASISGGKDSTAIYLLALERREKTGQDFLAVTADTGNEHPATYDYIRSLPRKTGGPEIVTVKADFSERFKKKRQTIKTKWANDGVPQQRIDRALELLLPTGTPFLDLCMLKGRFPSTRAQFCTQELKSIPLDNFVTTKILPIYKRAVCWQGERRLESKNRENLPMFQRIRWIEPEATILKYRPIVEWDANKVFEQHRRHGLAPNPLYKQGMGRVGCLPCINCAKPELKEIAARWPDAIDRVEEWERLVAGVSKRGLSSFFSANKTPYGQNPDGTYPGIRDVAEWARTSRGGRQFQLLDNPEPELCSSQYGLCE